MPTAKPSAARSERGDQRSGTSAERVNHGEEPIASAQRNHPIILPAHIGQEVEVHYTPGTRSTGAESGGITASSASPVGLFTSR